MNQPVPPPFPPPIPKRERASQNITRIVAACLGGFLLSQILTTAMSDSSIISFLIQLITTMSKFPIASSADPFHVTVLASRSRPDYFMERVRVEGERDMIVDLSVTELKAAGFFETNGPNGKIIYREGKPHRIGGSAPMPVSGGFPACDILFTVTTTATNTIWHEEIGGWRLDTTLPSPLTVSGIETNWPGAYERDWAVPLANLGDYKILVSVK